MQLLLLCTVLNKDWAAGTGCLAETGKPVDLGPFIQMKAQGGVIKGVVVEEW